MFHYLLRRIAGMSVTFFIIVTLSFVVVRLSPGSPLAQERRLSTAVESELRVRYGLDKPLYAQLRTYLVRLTRGDLGNSFKYPRRQVSTLLLEAMPPTLLLGAVSLCWALVLGVGLGFASALKPHGLLSQCVLLFTTLGVSLPTFVLGPLAVYTFSLKLHLAPAAGWGAVRHLVLPALTLGTPYAASIARLARGGMTETLDAPYLETARAKGMPLNRRLFVHALWGATRPLITYLGPATASIFTGSVVVERVFAIPGMGPFFVDAALNRDYALVMGVVIVGSALLLVLGLITDCLLAFIDPRVRLD